MQKENAIEILRELSDRVQNMREQGETDLRQVLYYIDIAIGQVDMSESEKE